MADRPSSPPARQPPDADVARRLYAVVRALSAGVLRVWFRVHISGAQNIPPEGPAIIAPNHKNFLDAFFIGIASPRPVRFMAKIELFRGPARWLFPRLGAFPVRRGEADAEAIDAARIILRSGGLVVVFPEGTRVEQPDALGSPHHGAGRLAHETGAPIVPAAITGTSHLWRGALPGVKRVQLAFLPPILPQDAPVSELIDAYVWPAVQREYGRLRAQPGLVTVALAGLGIGGGLLLKRQRPPQLPRIVGRIEPRKLRRRRRRARRRDHVRAWLHLPRG